MRQRISSGSRYAAIVLHPPCPPVGESPSPFPFPLPLREGEAEGGRGEEPLPLVAEAASPHACTTLDPPSGDFVTPKTIATCGPLAAPSYFLSCRVFD